MDLMDLYNQTSCESKEPHFIQQDFTPPTAPLTNVTNTKLLCCQSNTSIKNSAVTVTATGVNNNSGTSWIHTAPTTLMESDNDSLLMVMHLMEII